MSKRFTKITTRPFLRDLEFEIYFRSTMIFHLEYRDIRYNSTDALERGRASI